MSDTISKINGYYLKDNISGYQDAALTGTTSTVTYAEMVSALTAGQECYISHTDGTYGTFTFGSGWVYSSTLGVVGANGIFYYSDGYDGGYLLGQLICNSSGWSFAATYLATTSDIPTATSDLTNDSGFLTSAVTSVQVNATSPVNSSTSTAQTSTLSTTISLASGYGDTQNPYASKTANYVLAAPNGSAGTPSFRALVADDISDFSTEVNTIIASYDASNVSY